MPVRLLGRSDLSIAPGPVTWQHRQTRRTIGSLKLESPRISTNDKYSFRKNELKSARAKKIPPDASLFPRVIPLIGALYRSGGLGRHDSQKRRMCRITWSRGRDGLRIGFVLATQEF